MKIYCNTEPPCGEVEGSLDIWNARLPPSECLHKDSLAVAVNKITLNCQT